jgi:Beta-propeller repeat
MRFDDGVIAGPRAAAARRAATPRGRAPAAPGRPALVGLLAIAMACALWAALASEPAGSAAVSATSGAGLTAPGPSAAPAGMAPEPSAASAGVAPEPSAASAGVAPGSLAAPAAAASGAVPSAAPARAAYARLPLAFEANRGQQPAAVRYLARAGSGTVALTARGATLALARDGDRPASSLRLTFDGSAAASAVGRHRLPGIVSYLSGAHRVAAAPTFGRVAYDGVWPGIDAVFYGNRRRLEYDFVVAPRADAARIGLRFTGQGAARIAADGDLLLTLPGGRVVRELAPVAYQLAGASRQAVRSRYVLGARGEVRIAVGAYDHARRLVVDPVLTYATYLGGPGGAQGNAIAVDADGDAYVTGQTPSTSFTATGGGVQPAYGGGADDVFVTKLNPTGTAALYSTYLGGGDDDRGLAIAVGADGQAVVGGLTASTNFPTTAGAAQTTFGGGIGDAFVTRLNASGTALVYSTYLGGPAPTAAQGQGEKIDAIALDPSGAAYVAGSSFAGFPTTPGAFVANGPELVNSVAAKLSATGSLVYSTYFTTQNDGDYATGIAVNAAGNAYVTGVASAFIQGGATVTWPTTPGAYLTTNTGIANGYVTQLNASGTGLVYSTLLGTSFTTPSAIALDGGGRAYVTGSTSGGSGFPTTPDAVRPVSSRSTGFLSVLGASGATLDYSTYVGGTTNGDTPAAVAVDVAGNAYLVGTASSTDFPTTPNALKPTRSGQQDSFLSVLHPGASSYAYSSYLGTGGLMTGVGVTAAGSVLVAGSAAASGLATPGALNTTLTGGAFVERFDGLLPTGPVQPAPTATSGAATAITPDGATLNGTVTPNGGATRVVFEYGTTTAFGAITAPLGVGSAATPSGVSASIVGLSANTTYYYRLVATNSGGTAFGAVRALHTTGVPPAPPLVATLAASAVANTTATIGGQVNPNGQATAYTVEYGTTTSFGAIAPVVALDDAYALEPVAATLAGLQPDTTYYARVVASNATGTSAGSVVTFSTGPGGAPVVATGAATAIGATGATLTGTVDAHGVQTAFTFAYGTSAANLGSIGAVDSAGASNGVQSIALPIGGLAPGTTYVYRLVATNARGTSLGPIRTFTTAAAS